MNPIDAKMLTTILSGIVGGGIGFFWRGRGWSMVASILLISTVVLLPLLWRIFTESGVWTESHSFWLMAFVLWAWDSCGIPAVFAAIFVRTLSK